MAKCSTQQPAVRAEDADGNPLAAGIAVIASATGATLSGTASVETDAAGVATFTDLALSGPSGSYTLTFAATGLTGAESDAITLQTTASETGQWTAPITWPIVAIHTMLLPDGRVLAINRTNAPQIWDPATGTFKSVPAPANLFCSGHALLPDGRVFLAGGHIDDNQGLPNLTLFSATTDSWTSLPEPCPAAAGIRPRRSWGTVTWSFSPARTRFGERGPGSGSLDQRHPPAAHRCQLRRCRTTRGHSSRPNGRVYVAGPAKNTRFLTT